MTIENDAIGFLDGLERRAREHEQLKDDYKRLERHYEFQCAAAKCAIEQANHFRDLAKEGQLSSEVLYHCLCEVADQRDEQANELGKLHAENQALLRAHNARSAIRYETGIRLAALEKERDELRAKLEKAEAASKTARIDEAYQKQECAELRRRLECMKRSRDVASERADKAEAERDEAEAEQDRESERADRAEARLKELEAERNDHKYWREMWQKRFDGQCNQTREEWTKRTAAEARVKELEAELAFKREIAIAKAKAQEPSMRPEQEDAHWRPCGYAEAVAELEKIKSHARAVIEDERRSIRAIAAFDAYERERGNGNDSAQALKKDSNG